MKKITTLFEDGLMWLSGHPFLFSEVIGVCTLIVIVLLMRILFNTNVGKWYWGPLLVTLIISPLVFFGIPFVGKYQTHWVFWAIIGSIILLIFFVWLLPKIKVGKLNWNGGKVLETAIIAAAIVLGIYYIARPGYEHYKWKRESKQSYYRSPNVGNRIPSPKFKNFNWGPNTFEKGVTYEYDRGTALYYFGESESDFKAIFSYWKKANPKNKWNVGYDSRGIAYRFNPENRNAPIVDDGTGGTVCFRVNKNCNFTVKNVP